MIPLLILSLSSLCLALPTPSTPAGASLKSILRGFHPGHVTTVSSDDGLKWYNADLTHGASAPESSYQCFGGDVTRYPSIDRWRSFNELWARASPTIQKLDGPDLTNVIHDTIIAISKDSKVDARFVLATIMQESSGNVDNPCTGNGNCGLMQAGRGSVSYDPKAPAASIRQMVVDGVQGTADRGGYGLAHYVGAGSSMAWTNDRWPGNPYVAARLYNSGVVGASGSLDDISGSKGSTESYANDVANRLVGWDGTGEGFGGCKS